MIIFLRQRLITWLKKLCYSGFISASFLFTLKKRDIDDIIALLKYKKDNIKLIYINQYKKRNYFILASFIVNYDKQMLIKSIKINIQFLISYIF